MFSRMLHTLDLLVCSSCLNFSILSNLSDSWSSCSLPPNGLQSTIVQLGQKGTKPPPSNTTGGQRYLCVSHPPVCPTPCPLHPPNWTHSCSYTSCCLSFCQWQSLCMCYSFFCDKCDHKTPRNVSGTLTPLLSEQDKIIRIRIFDVVRIDKGR